MNGYVLTDTSCIASYSADPRDYWMFEPMTRFDNQVLLKLRHRFRTNTGRIILAPKVLKSNPRMRDLLRLERAYMSVTQGRGA